MKRSGGRRAGDLRPVEIIRGYTRNAAGSALIRTGGTTVLCTACWEREVPMWKSSKGGGWLTAEYDMLPGATGERRARNRLRIDGRTQEIQRLIGRSLRAVVDLGALGENTILVDCDVLQADGGTRTASITGAFVAVSDAVRAALSNKWIAESPIRDQVAAVSVGLIGGRALLDLDYAEDSGAEVDFNVVMTGAGRFVEVQGTGEKTSFSRSELDRLLRLASRGVRGLLECQSKALRRQR